MNLQVLEAKLQETEAKYEGQEVPKPPFWGGFRLRPVAVEFWLSRPNRLHDRLRYIKQDQGPWTLQRLSP